MPTYEYYCEANDTTVEVLHSMDGVILTWGELCACAGVDAGNTPTHTVVERKLSAVSLLPKKSEGGIAYGGGCCGGGGCGCGGH